jgi:hypothetical protein
VTAAGVVIGWKAENKTARPAFAKRAFGYRKQAATSGAQISKKRAGNLQINPS